MAVDLSSRDIHIELPKGATVLITAPDGHVEPVAAIAIKVEMP